MLDFDIGPSPLPLKMSVVCAAAGTRKGGADFTDILGIDTTMEWCTEGWKKAFACCPWNVAKEGSTQEDRVYYVS
jgi:hypothetical protein